MADDLDRMLQGDDQDFSSDTPSGSNSSGSDDGTGVGDGTQGTSGSEEEVEWGKLSGNATDRFRKVYRDKQTAIQERDQLRKLLQQQGNQPTTDANGNVVMNDQVKAAVDRLSNVGIATKDFVKQEVLNALAQQQYSDELGKLEAKENGQNDRPAFIREEYFEFINRNPQYKNYLPEDVYPKMYATELADWSEKHQGTEPNQRRTQTLRPTRTASRETELTVDEIEAKLKSLPEPQRSQWYAANQEKINAAVQRSAQG